MHEALSLVKKTLGSEAVILGTRSVKPTGIGGALRRDEVEISAAPPSVEVASAGPSKRVAAASPPPPRESRAPDVVQRFYTRLVRNEVGTQLARRLVDAVARLSPGDALDDESAVRDKLKHFIARLLPACGGVELDSSSPRRVALVGPTGAGKTTTLAKLAAHFKLREKKSVAIVSLDVFRIGAQQQLERYAEIIGVPMRAAASSQDVEQACESFAKTDLVLIDTPGIGLKDGRRMSELKALMHTAAPHEIHLVLPSSMSAIGVHRAGRAFGAVGVTHVVFSKLDDVLGCGVVLNAMQKMDWKLSYLTDGQNVPCDIIPACGERVAELILQESVVRSGVLLP